jgi:methyl-accepting chemotaxis protein
MTVNTLPAPLAPEAQIAALRPVPQPRRRRRRATAGLNMRLWLATAAVALPTVVLATVAAINLPGALRALAIALGACAVLALAVGSYWLLRGILYPAIRASEAALRMSAGDLTRPVDARHGGEVRPLLEALEEMRQHLITVVGQVRSGTAQVAMNSSQITRDNEALALRTQTQAESLQQTAATMEEMTAAVRHNAETAQRANALVRSASGQAEQGGQVMNEVVQTMGSIRDSSRSIGDIIGVIDGIAFQTNILALNAAVEAARAGEQGRGFAVVASEVRTLAQRSADAARQIKDLIGASVDKVEAGGQRVDAAGRAMTEIVAAVRQVAELIGHIDVASREQSEGIESVNGAVARIERTTQENATLVQDARRTASALHERAVALMKGVAVFDLGDREHGTTDEAVDLVRRGCAFAQAHGRDALIAEVNRLASGQFVDRDLYLMVLDAASGVFLAHGNNPRTLGSGPQSKDVDGRPFVLEMTETARRRGEGWVDYKWAHPVTNEVLTKSSFVQRVGDVVVACGVYR